MPSVTTTIISLVIAIAVAVFANWQMRRPFDRRFLPVVPWLGVQFLAAVIVLIMAAHLISLLTGASFGHRY